MDRTEVDKICSNIKEIAQNNIARIEEMMKAKGLLVDNPTEGRQIQEMLRFNNLKSEILYNANKQCNEVLNYLNSAKG